MTSEKIPKLTKRDMEKCSEIVIDVTKFLDIVHRLILSKNTMGIGKWAMRNQRIARNAVVYDSGFFTPNITEDIVKYVNRILNRNMNEDEVKRITIRFDDGEERVFHKPIVSEFVNIPPRKAPAKMKSKKMYRKKFSAKKSPVKRMTGNISELGKNFNKLI